MTTTTTPYSFKYYSHLPQELKDIVLSYTHPHPIAGIIKEEKARLLAKFYNGIRYGYGYDYFDEENSYYVLHTHHYLYSFEDYCEAKYDFDEIVENIEYDDWANSQYVIYTRFLQYQFSKIMKDEYITLDYLYFMVCKEYRFN
jgi:hypothetical protein